MAGEILGAVALAFLCSVCLTWIIRKRALAHGVLDIPNERSSHSVAVPRGGGIAIVFLALLAVLLQASASVIPLALAIPLLAGGAAIGLIGFVDDLRPVAPEWRLAVHICSAVCTAWSLGRGAVVDCGFFTCHQGVIALIVGILTLVWFINLFNFMDGIDGLASVEAISAALAAAFLLLGTGGSQLMPQWLLLIFAAIVAGFLVLNWPPAKIFMGDSGSGFLGYMLGTIAWSTVVNGSLSIWVWLILFGCFFVDASLTLARRWRRGEKLHVAHRSHAYQRLSRRFQSHRAVTLGFLGVNLGWLLPFAWAACEYRAWGPALTAFAWLPLVIVAWRSGAGLAGD